LAGRVSGGGIDGVIGAAAGGCVVLLMVLSLSI